MSFALRIPIRSPPHEDLPMLQHLSPLLAALPFITPSSAQGHQLQAPSNSPVALEESGVAPHCFWADYEADGLTDVLMLSSQGGGSLYRNVGLGQYADVTLALGLFAKLDGAFAAAFGDFNADGRLELFLPSYHYGSRLLQ